MARDDRVQRDVLSETVPGRQLESGEVSLVPPQLDGALAELAEQYIIEAQAGAGGMGAVYRAVERSSGERLALKVMLPSDAVDADARANDVERFVREAASLAELSHPCIVRYRMHGSTRSGTAFLGMEWLDGEDLARRLSRAPLTTTQTVTLVRQACQGVAVVHALGIVHLVISGT